jgi:NAD+ synthase
MNIISKIQVSMMDLIPRLDTHSSTIIKDFIRDRFEEAGASCVVIGLSGGLDSALALGLVVQALGPARVRAIFMPYGELSGPDRDFSVKAAEAFGVELIEKDIGNMVDSIPFEMEGMVKGNAQARTRMVLLYTIANMENGLVIGTSNKTELLLGYFTKYGDGGADLYPIGDLYKTQARLLAKDIGVPQEIIDRPPSAGLIKGQTDEGELRLPYPIIDQVLYGLLRDMDPEDIADRVDLTTTTVDEMDRAGFDPPLTEERILDIIASVKRAKHKRWSLIVPKIEIATVGLDLRERW